jgi:cyclopropane fatty-acyl-phospholipid synthase-like methyltransferase
MDPRLAGADVMIMSISEVENKSFDVVLAIDVIEHVEHPLGFLSELARVARIGVFLTTPNWTASRNRWSYHLREYKPREFQELTKRIGHVTMFKGTQSGSEIHQVRNQQSYFLLNDLRTFIPTALLGRLVNLLLPGPCKIHSTLAAWCDIGGATETSS